MKTAYSLDVAGAKPSAARVMPSSRRVAALVAAATLSLFGLAAQAQSSDQPKTREQVRAELVEARANGELNSHLHGDDAHFRPQTFVSTKSRAQVRQETAEARANGELDHYLQGEVYPAQNVVSTKSRAEVRAEAARAAAEQRGLSRGQWTQG